MRSPSWPAVNGRRFAQHGLARPLPAGTGMDVVAAAVSGVHAQVLSAAEVSAALRVEGATREDVRRALWLERVDRDGWWVRFEDGTDFHPWSPGETVTHPCSPDTYVGLVDGAGDTWAIRWDVTGPSKDYTMTTELTR